MSMTNLPFAALGDDVGPFQLGGFMAASRACCPAAGRLLVSPLAAAEVAPPPPVLPPPADELADTVEQPASSAPAASPTRILPVLRVRRGELIFI
jgi:hypothetical protein